MSSEQKIRIWDPWVRIFHWSLAVSIVFMLISGSTGFLFFDWHRTAGEIILALFIFRLLWGIFGSSNARLLQLVTHPLAALTHLKDLFTRQAHAERGHNAAGSWAVVIMLLMVGIQAITGLYIADEDELLEGALYGSVSSSLSDWMYQVHHTNAELLKIVVIVHVVMVFFYLVFARQNLITPMLTGTMKWLSNKNPPDVVFQKSIVGLALACGTALAVGYVVDWF